jgi:ribosomal protein S30
MTKKEEKQAAAEVKKMGQKGGRGTHGSLTKAGKVRGQTIKIAKTNLAKHKGPSVKNRKRWIKSLTHPKKNEHGDMV